MIKYIDRRTSALCEERVYGGKALSRLYGDSFSTKVFFRFFLPLLAQFPFWSQFYGYLQKRPSSRAKIKPFISAYGIDASEFQTQNFTSFNDFFIRKLIPAARPIDPNPNVITMPADGRYLAYQKFDRFFVKGQEFSISDFLQDPILSDRYDFGSMLIARLCPTDYHRFHFPCDGVPGEPRLINGHLFSVNPIALRRRIAILSENKRMITEIETERFGKILYVEIGATSVGTIQQTYVPNQRVKKGDEKGYFEFGGSCLVLLFEPNKVRFDEDLIANTAQGLETLCRFGTSIGRY